MEEEYTIYEDVLKLVIAIMVYMLFFIGLVMIIMFQSLPIIVDIMIAGLALLFVAIILSNSKKLYKRHPLYQLSEKGIYDYTKAGDELFLSWQEVMKVEMIANNSSLQIGILASKTMEVREEMSKRMKENLRENGNHVFYSIMLDGFQFHKKHFQEIYHKIKLFGLKGNSDIIFIDYEDPILKKKRSNNKGIR